MMRMDCKNCMVRDWLLTDKDSIAKYANNARVANNLTKMPHPYAEADAMEFLQEQVRHPERTGWAIEVAGSAVGAIGITLRDGVLIKNALFGYWLAEPYWGRGIMTAAVAGMAPYVMQRFALERLEATVFTGNTTSMRVLEKCGFEREGVMRNSVFKNGRLFSSALYARLKKD